MLAETALDDLRQVRMRLDVDLVDDRTDHPDAMRREERAVEHDLVDRAADAALADDDDRRVEHRGDARVREPDDRADSRVPGALDDDHVLVRGDPLVRGRDLRPEIVVDAAHHVVGREVARQGDRRHVVERIG